jgi:hypothetical protein
MMAPGVAMVPAVMAARPAASSGYAITKPGGKTAGIVVIVPLPSV